MQGEFNPEVCPIGITNEKSIENLGDRVDMAIERLTEKVSEVKEDIVSLSKNVDSKFESMDEKFDAIDVKLENVDKKFDAMEDKFYTKLSELKKRIPDTVDQEIERKQGNMASNAIKWLFSGVLGGIVISVAISWVKLKLGL